MLASSKFIRALRKEKFATPPVWFMRQAGRYLPEYREVRAQHSMLDVIRTPSLAAKVTLQPIDRFGFDASIIFADILNPLIGMGISLDFIEGEGPKIFTPITNLQDVEKLTVPTPEENVGYTLEAIRLVTKELTPRGVPLIGFSGAPFTLSSYLLNGTGERDIAHTTRFMRDEESAWRQLQEKLSSLISDYLIAQVRAGASAVQIFDSWVGAVSPSEFTHYVYPYLQEIVRRVRAAVEVPIIFFAPQTAGLYSLISTLGVDAVGIDWRIRLAEASTLLGGNMTLQGNLDPTLLLGKGGRLESEVERIVKEGRDLPGFIFNLGHGILPQTPIAHVERVLRVIRA